MLQYLRQGYRIIDLGCGGGIDSFFVSPDQDYSPTLSRILHYMGYDVTGIDVADNSKEPSGQ